MANITRVNLLKQANIVAAESAELLRSFGRIGEERLNGFVGQGAVFLGKLLMQPSIRTLENLSRSWEYKELRQACTDRLGVNEDYDLVADPSLIGDVFEAPGLGNDIDLTLKPGSEPQCNYFHFEWENILTVQPGKEAHSQTIATGDLMKYVVDISRHQAWEITTLCEYGIDTREPEKTKLISWPKGPSDWQQLTAARANQLTQLVRRAKP